MKKFHEYLSSRGNVQATADVKVVADKVDVPAGRAKMPPKEAGRPKNCQPYSADGKRVVRGENKGFGDHGDRKLMYDVTKKTSAASLPTAESFAHHQLFPQIRDLLVSNPTLVENLVRELQRKNLLGVLVGEMLAHNETYGHIAEVMASRSHGYSVCRKLAKAMREDVASPFHLAGQGNDLDPNAGLGQDPMLGGASNPDDDMPSIDFGGQHHGHDHSHMHELPDDQEGVFDDNEDDGLDDGLDDPNADPNAPPADPNADPNAPPADPNADPNAPPADPNAPPPQPGQPVPPVPQPPLPPAMENMRRAWRTVVENYRPLSVVCKK